MHSTAEINAVINKAKQQRADFIASKVQGGVLPIALAALVSLALVHLSSEATPNQAQRHSAVQASAQNG